LSFKTAIEMGVDEEINALVKNHSQKETTVAPIGPLPARPVADGPSKTCDLL
jgi:hypothetical protein